MTTIGDNRGSILDSLYKTQTSTDFFLQGKRIKKRANSCNRASNLTRQEINLHDEEILRILEENKKLEDQINQLQTDNNLSKENQQLRDELYNVKSQLTEQEQTVGLVQNCIFPQEFSINSHKIHTFF